MSEKEYYTGMDKGTICFLLFSKIKVTHHPVTGKEYTPAHTRDIGEVKKTNENNTTDTK